VSPVRQRANSILVLLAAGILLTTPGTAVAATKSKTVTTSGDGGIATALVKCPKGQLAAGGGFRTTPASPANELDVFESRKIGQRSWRVSAQNHDASVPAEAVGLTVIAYCGKNLAKTKSAQTTAVGSGSVTADAFCKKGRKSHAGGFLFSPTTAGVPNLVRASGSFKFNQWGTTVANAGASVSVTTYAYCAKHNPLLVEGQRDAPPSLFAAVTAQTRKCARGGKPLAGGFHQTGVGIADRLSIYESVRAGSRWRTAGVVTGLTSGSTLFAEGLCG
jgi:hypothetical protein